MPFAELRDFYAIAVYFAALTLWTFGHLSSARETPNDTLKDSGRSSGVQPEGQPSVLVINREETSAARSFVSGRKLTPVLQPVMSKLQSDGMESYDGTVVGLDDSNAVFQMARDPLPAQFSCRMRITAAACGEYGEVDGRSWQSARRSVFKVCKSGGTSTVVQIIILSLPLYHVT